MLISQQVFDPDLVEDNNGLNIVLLADYPTISSRAPRNLQLSD